MSIFVCNIGRYLSANRAVAIEDTRFSQARVLGGVGNGDGLLVQDAPEQLPIRVIDDHIFLAIAAIHHGLYRPFALDPQLAWQAQNHPGKVDKCHYASLTPLTRRGSIKLPLFPCAADAPARRMSRAAITALEQETLTHEDLERLGLSL